MTVSYSAATGGFYWPGDAAPDDAVAITAERHAELMAAQEIGGTIVADADGAPIAVMPPPVPPLDHARAAALAAVRAAFDTRIAAGMPWDGKVLQIDDASCQLLTSADAMAAAGGLPDGFAWRMADNSFLPLDAEGLRAMALATGAYVYALRATVWRLTDAIRAAETVGEVEAVDITAGWPG